jgi:hypothetical protein
MTPRRHSCRNSRRGASITQAARLVFPFSVASGANTASKKSPEPPGPSQEPSLVQASYLPKRRRLRLLRRQKGGQCAVRCSG